MNVYKVIYYLVQKYHSLSFLALTLEKAEVRTDNGVVAFIVFVYRHGSRFLLLTQIRGKCTSAIKILLELVDVLSLFCSP
jgi:hypothetical protein